MKSIQPLPHHRQRRRARSRQLDNEQEDDENLSHSCNSNSSVGHTPKLEDEKSLFVCSAQIENDAYVANAINDEEMDSGIVIAHSNITTIDNEDFLDPEDFAEMEAIRTVFNLEDVTDRELPRDEMKKKLNDMYDFYADEDIMNSMLTGKIERKQSVDETPAPSPSPSPSPQLPPPSPIPIFTPSNVSEVYKNYGCRRVVSGGPVAIKDLAASYIKNTMVDDSFYIMDLGNVQRLYNAWHTAMPRVTPFYAVKCSPMPALIDVMKSNCCGFDCASAAEITMVMDAGVDPSRIIFAHPAKRPYDIRFAAEKNCLKTTFDSLVELEKIAKWHPKAQCVLRIRADDPEAKISFGIKYGANEDEFEPLMEAANKLGLDVIGVSFHVGSLARSGKAFYDAIKLSRVAFNVGRSSGFEFTLLDIGGGFTGRFNSKGVVQSMVGDIPAEINRVSERAKRASFDEDEKYIRATTKLTLLHSLPPASLKMRTISLRSAGAGSGRVLWTRARRV